MSNSSCACDFSHFFSFLSFFLRGIKHKVLILYKFSIKQNPDLKPGLTCFIISRCWINYANLKTRFLFQLPYMYYHSCNRPLHACLSAKPSQSWLWHNSKHTITSTYDARTLVLFNSKIIHPKQPDSNTSSYNNPIFTISDTGSPTQSNGSSNGGLRIVSYETISQKGLRGLDPRELW